MVRLTPFRARLVLAGLLAVLAFGVLDRRSIVLPARDPAAGVGDVNLQLWTIQRIRAGEPYYAAVGGELRKHGYPTSPIVNWRTPLHYSAVAALSIERAGTLLFALGMAAVITGALAYVRCSVSKAVAAALLLLGSLAPALLMRPDAVVFPEVWAGVVMALSLNAYVSRQWVLGAALGVLAVFVRELAVPYGVVCGLLAWRGGRRSESLVWVIGGIAFAVYYTAHAVAASAAIQPDDLARVSSYARWLGLPFVFRTLVTNGLLTPLPAIVIPIAAALGLAGGWSRNAPEQLSASLLLYFALFCVVGQPFNFYWGYLTCGIWGHAFVHGAEGTAAILRAARPAPVAPAGPVSHSQGGLVS